MRVQIDTKELKEWLNHYPNAYLEIYKGPDATRVIFYNCDSEGNLQKGNIDPMYYIVEDEE